MRRRRRMGMRMEFGDESEDRDGGWGTSEDFQKL